MNDTSVTSCSIPSRFGSRLQSNTPVLQSLGGSLNGSGTCAQSSSGTCCFTRTAKHYVLRTTRSCTLVHSKQCRTICQVSNPRTCCLCAVLWRGAKSFCDFFPYSASKRTHERGHHSQFPTSVILLPANDHLSSLVTHLTDVQHTSPALSRPTDKGHRTQCRIAL
jgi:hypothetical protein